MSRNVIVKGLFALMLVGLIGTPARAQQSLAAGSLAFVPGNVHYYQSTLRLGEQWNIVKKSKAWAKLTSLPEVKKLLAKAKEEWDNPFGQLAIVRAWYEQPENRDLVDLLKQMCDEEAFFYTGADATQFALLLGELNSANSMAPLAALAKGNAPGGGNDASVQIRTMLQTLNANTEKIKMPDFVIGFKIPDPKKAKAQLKRLEDLAQFLPPNAFEKGKIGGGEYLTVRGDGTMVPWEALPIRDYEERQGEFDNLMKKLRSLKVAFSIGIRDSYLLISFGSSTDQLKSLGQQPLLAAREELQPIAKFADKKVTTVTYMSKAARELFTPSAKDMEKQFLSFVDMAENAEVITKAKAAEIRSDVKKAVKDFAHTFPVVGGSSSVGFMTATGAEGFNYDWTKSNVVDFSKQLDILSHVGGSPLLYVASRTKPDPRSYDASVKLVRTLVKHFEEVGLPKLPDDARQQYGDIMKVVRPAFKRLDKTTRTKLMPAMADGQSAFILDSKLKSTQWHFAMPAAADPLPLPEIAMAMGITDPELLRKAFEEYRLTFNDFINDLGTLYPQIPPVVIPQPDSRKVENGTLYYYPLEGTGLDPRIAPTAGLGKKVAVIALSQEHAKRLLTPTPPQMMGSLKSKLKGPLGGAVYLNWAGMVQAATPWVNYGMREGNADDNVATHVRAILEVLQVCRTFSSVTYQEGGASVTHTETVIRDIE